MSTFTEQAVTPELSLGTIIDLLRIASKPNCPAVRYQAPRPESFGLFIDMPASARFEPIPHGQLTLNQLIEVTVPVVEKIAGWYDSMRKAQQDSREARDRVRFLMSKFSSYGIDPDYVHVPEVYYTKNADGQYVPADPQP